MYCNVNKFDMCVNQGATYTQQLTIKASDGSNIDGISTATLASQIRSSYTSSTVVASFTFTWVDHANGVVTMSLSATTTTGIPAGDYVYDTELTLPSGTVYRILEGKVKVRPEVTR